MQPVRDHGDEFAVGGLALGVAHREPEIFLQGVQVTPVPGHLDGVADGPLHPGCCGAELPGHLGVENLGHGVDHIHVLHGHDDGLPQVLVALDVGGDPDLVDDGGDVGLQGLPGGDRQAGGGIFLRPVLRGQQTDALDNRRDPAGLHHVVVPALGGHFVGYGASGKAGQDQGAHDGIQDVVPVHAMQDQVHHQHIRGELLGQANGFLSVVCLTDHFQALLALQSFCQDAAEFLAGVGNENRFLVFHACVSPPWEGGNSAFPVSMFQIR